MKQYIPNHMKIQSIYLGTWVQRTSIHLKEIYNFLSDKKTVSGLDDQKSRQFWEGLKLTDVELHEELDFDFIKAKDKDASVVITEDGVILLRHNGESINDAIKEFDDLYSNRLGKAINFLFSLGAPLPKELTKVDELFPVIVIASGASQDGIKSIFESNSDKLISSSKEDSISIYDGERTIVVHIDNTESPLEISLEDLVTYLVFIREFEVQLSNYLNLHRTIWDRISLIRESKSLKYNDFPRVREKILDFLREISFVKARLEQMRNNIVSRDKLIEPKLEQTIRVLGINRFDHLEANQKYIRELWTMTEDYATGTLSLLDSLFSENTQIELNAIKFFTLVAAMTSFFGMNIAFPWEERWGDVYQSSIEVVILILVLCLILYFVITKFIYQRKFKISFGKDPYRPGNK